MVFSTAHFAIALFAMMFDSGANRLPHTAAVCALPNALAGSDMPCRSQ